jgi:5-formyltetrahydrofolate cyclo-ligase
MVVIPYRFKSKDELRKWLWKYLSDYHLKMVPRPCFARIPGFKAQDVAVARLVKEPAWDDAEAVVIGPDDVTLEARVEAMRAGKRLLVPVPGEATCHLLEGVSRKDARVAAILKEMGRFSRIVPLSEAAGTPLLVTGALSVDRFGHWLGQGAVFGELPEDITRADGLLRQAFRIALVDDMQIFEDFGYLIDPAEARVDRIVTKTQSLTPQAPAVAEPGLPPA